MTHAQLVEKAIRWLRSYRCGVVLSEQACVSGEMPDAIGWKRACHSVLVECKVTRSDFLADRSKPFRVKPERGVGCERFYLAPAGLIQCEELPKGWGLLECRGGRIELVAQSMKKRRSGPSWWWTMKKSCANRWRRGCARTAIALTPRRRTKGGGNGAIDRLRDLLHRSENAWGMDGIETMMEIHRFTQASSSSSPPTPRWTRPSRP